MCECCGNSVMKTDLSMNCELKELGFLGVGVPLYFNFLKLSMVNLLMISLISGIYNLTKNTRGSACSKIPSCDPSLISNKYSIINRDNV